MIQVVRLILLTALTSLLAINSTAKEPVPARTSYHLPFTVYPVHYSLRLEIPADLDSVNIYTGQVDISLSVPFPTNVIVLHAASGVEIHSVGLRWGTQDVPIAAIERESETQFLKIHTEDPIVSLEDGVYRLLIDFSGTFGRHVQRGFFKQSLREMIEGDIATGEERFFAMAAFEPTYARSAFPCFDEPLYRASFDVEVISGMEYSVRSNGDLLEEQDFDQFRKRTRFHRTPPMATYLLAILVSRFDETTRYYNGLRIGMLTRPIGDDDEALDFAFDMTANALQALQGYTGQPYPFPKLHQVGVEGFTGGLENWGLIIYAEDYLLVGPEATIWEQIESAGLIAHELAHQFFGNLVGIAWWDHLWVKEGFSTFLATKLCLDLLPEAHWTIRYQYERHTWTVLNYDAGPLTHSMYYGVEHPDEIQALYHGGDHMIVYDKAARVISMMELALGPSVFSAGIQQFIAKYQFTSAFPSNLYQSLHEAAAGSTSTLQEAHVAQLFDSWVYQAGHPIVYVQRIGNTNKYRFTQRPFRACPCSPHSRWWIPIFYSDYDLVEEFGGSPAFWMPPYRDSVIVTIEGSLPLVNARSYGFYRVNYWQQGWIEVLGNWHRIDGSSRAKLLNDAFSLQWDQGTYFEPLYLMLDKLWSDDDPLPWLAAMADHNLWRLVQLCRGKIDLVQDMLTIASRATSTMWRLFQNASSAGSAEAGQLALKWTCRLGMDDCSNMGRSFDDDGICQALLTPAYLADLQCDSESVETLIYAGEFGMCFTDAALFRRFLDNVLNNFRCPTMLDVIVAVLSTGIPYVDQLLEALTAQVDLLQFIPGSRHLEVFLRTIASHIYEPYQQQLMMQFMDQLEGISEVQRSSISKLMETQLSSVVEVLSSLKQYLSRAVSLEQITDGVENKNNF